MTVNEMIDVLCIHAGFHPRLEHDVSKPSAIPARRVDISKALSLDWRPQVMMKEGLERTHDWYANHR